MPQKFKHKFVDLIEFNTTFCMFIHQTYIQSELSSCGLEVSSKINTIN